MSASSAQKVLRSFSLAWKRRNPGLPRPYENALELGLIEPRIAEMVSHLNVPGIVRTYACCEGHERVGDVELPYVAFAAEIDFVRVLNLKLLGAAPGHGALKHHWIVEYGQSFALRPHAPGKLRREAMDSDFATLCRIVDEAVREQN